MPKYRTKPVIVDAIQWNGKNLDEVIEFMKGPEHGHSQLTIDFDMDIIVYSKDGDLKAKVGDWIIKGPKERLFTIKEKDFQDHYQKVIRDRIRKKVPFE